MNWLVPLAGIPKGRAFDRHRPEYFREYFERNYTALRAYRTEKMREYRARKSNRATTRGRLIAGTQSSRQAAVARPVQGR